MHIITRDISSSYNYVKFSFSIFFFLSGLFCKYDFGETKNEQMYGQKNPPEYDIKAIKCPVVTYWGDNDWLVEPTVRNFLLSLAKLMSIS